MVGPIYLLLFGKIFANFPRPTIFEDGFTPEGECYVFPWERVHFTITRGKPQGGWKIVILINLTDQRYE